MKYPMLHVNSRAGALRISCISNFKCDYCGAPKGFYCVNEKGFQTPMHSARARSHGRWKRGEG